MRAVSRTSWPIWIGAAIAFTGILIWHRSANAAFPGSQFGSGYILMALIVFLALYTGRKRLRMLPVGRASVWLTLHVVGGLLALPLFWFHAGMLWPAGPVGGTLAALFYGVSLSGILGYGLQLWFSRRLTQAGDEAIYERIPAEITQIRAEVEEVIRKAAEESGNDTLGQDYLQTLAWYFARPRFFWNSAFGGFGRRAEIWMQHHLDTIGRYLTPAETTQLAHIATLAAKKRGVDVQYAMQSLLKRWTMIHVPLAVAMLTLAVWHLILVNVFAR
jgi:hypothetical protein